MSKVVRHLKQNVVAYLALFVALGGTSYAAISIPRNSVGAKQLRNHSIDPVKLDRKAFGGYVRMWARVDANGKIIASSPKAKVLVWYPASFTNKGGQIEWSLGVSPRCFALANAESFPGTTAASAVLITAKGGTTVGISIGSEQPVDVAVICPLA